MSLVVSNPAARTQPGKSPDSTTRQPGNPAAPGNPATRQHPAAPGSTPAPGNPALTRQHPGNPATRPGNTRQPGTQGSSHAAPKRCGSELQLEL